MNDTIGDKTLLRNYLLGVLKDEAILDRIEIQLITDAEYAGSIDVAENDLIEEYLDGALNAEDLGHFTRHFLVSPGRQRQLRLIENIRKVSAGAEHVFPLAKRGGFFDWTPNLSIKWLRFAALAFIIAGAGFGVWRFAVFQSDTDKSLAELRAAYRGTRPLQARITALPDHVQFSETRGDATVAVDPAAIERARLYLLKPTSDPGNADAHHASGLIFLAEKKYEEALRELKLALASKPGDARLQSDTGAAYLAMEKRRPDQSNGARTFELLSESLKHTDIAIALDPKMREPRFNRALCLQTLHYTEQAKKAWREYIEVDPASDWTREARQNLEDLEAASRPERSAAELENDLLDAMRSGDEAEAGRLLAANREPIRDKYLPIRLSMSYLVAPDERRDELLDALRLTGRIEMKLTGDPFANEIARFYFTLPADRRPLLAQAHADLRRGYERCLAFDYTVAKTEFEKARKAFGAAGDIMEQALADYFIGYALFNLNQAVDSYKSLAPVADFARAGGYLWLEMTALHWIGGSYYRRGDYTSARRSYENALSIAERIEDAYALERNLSQLAFLLSYNGEIAGALDYQVRAQLASSRPGSSVRQRYRNVEPAVALLSKAKLMAAAKYAALEADSIAAFAGDEMWLALAPSQVGSALVRMGEIDDARAWIDAGRLKAGQIRVEKMRNQMLAFSSLRLGALESRTGDFESAEQHYTSAAAYYDGTEMQALREEANTGLMGALAALGRDDELARRIPANIEFIEQYREKIRDERDRTSFFGTRVSVYDIAAALEHKRGNDERAFDYTEMSSSRVLLDGLEKGAPAAVDGAPAMATPQGTAKPLGLRDIQARMPAGTQIVEYTVLDDRLLVWVVTRENFAVRTVTLRATDLDDKIREFSLAVSRPGGSPGSDTKRLGSELYALLINPVRDLLDPEKELCLVPGKVLFNLPFAAVIAPDGRPLMAEFELLYAPSANVFLKCTENAAARPTGKAERLVAVGDPAFDVEKFKDLPSLPAAADEVRDIAGSYGGQSVLIGENARKTSFLKAVPDAEVIHVAAHYVVNRQSPISSYLLFAREGADAENSKLTNLEIGTLRFPRARLIVLAGCQTGVESYYDGEGMMGLSRTFLAADVPVVVASRWDVDTVATAALMRRFHQYRALDKLSTARALRRAQLEMLGDKTGRFSDPFYWAAFAVFGGHSDY